MEIDSSARRSPVKGTTELYVDVRLSRPERDRATAAGGKGDPRVRDSVRGISLSRLRVSDHEQEEVTESRELDWTSRLRPCCAVRYPASDVFTRRSRAFLGRGRRVESCRYVRIGRPDGRERRSCISIDVARVSAETG